MKTQDQVKGLKMDYGFGGFGGPPGSGGPGSLFGAGAFHGQYQSVSQKIMRKSLGENACKLLDSANEKLTKILNTGVGIYLKTKQRKKLTKLGEDEDSDKDMEGDEDAEKSNSDNEDQESHSDEYSDIDEEEEEEMEAAEMEKSRLLDLFVEEFPDEILNSDVPEEE